MRTPGNSTISTVELKADKVKEKPLKATMCLLPENLDRTVWGDTTTLDRSAVKLSLQACNDFNMSVNTINGAE